MAKKNKTKPSPASVPETGNKKKGKRQGKDAVEDIKQNEKLANKAKQQANRAKVASTASWTGKLPHTLLHETCVKRKWNKVEYDMKKIGDKGMLAIAVLSYTDPKTKEVLKIRMNDPTYDKTSDKGLLVPQETTLEARHFAATVALCRISYNTNMHMMLPPNHKNLWYDLLDYRKKMLEENEWRANKVFDVDPFKTLLEDRKVKEQKDKENAARNTQREKQEKVTINVSLGTKLDKKAGPTKSNDKKAGVQKASSDDRKLSLVHFPKKVWEKAVFIDFDEDTRAMIESSLKMYTNWNAKKFTGNNLDKERQLLKEKLINISFRPVHVEEAMNYKDPLSFLLFNLPEDDLPPFFHKKRSDSKNKIEISLLPINTKNKLERLMESGISNDEALHALQINNEDEAAAASYLTSQVRPDISSSELESIDDEESLDIWSQELDSLQAIYDDKIEVINKSKCYQIMLFEKLHLKVKFYKSKFYPSTLPGIIISTFDRQYKLPNYIKKQVLEKVLKYIDETSMLGRPLIYDVYEWLMEHLEKIIKSPGPLLTTNDVESSGSISQSKNKNKNNNSIQKKSRKRHELSDTEVKALSEEYKRRITTQDYEIMQEIRKQLPAWKKQETIVDMVFKNDIVLITGETGSGKSTQVVQFLLDNLQRDKNDFGETSIICTQPRRISAIGLAERVSDERCVPCGDEVGYIIRGVNKTKASTRIKFMTTGVLVRILQSDPKFLTNSIVVIDEVHERSIDTDLIVILLKHMLLKISNLKIVLMSATVNVDAFSNYFPDLKTCHIEGRTFPIEDFFLDDILDLVDFKIKKTKRLEYHSDDDESNEYLKPGADSKFFRSGQINYDLIGETAVYIDSELSAKSDDGSIIIFLPGVSEISRCVRILQNLNDRFKVLPLHSALSAEDQKLVFKRFKGKRKIIVSTNIAETSITIDDCVCTIDSGKAKSMYYNPKDNTTKLMESFISKAESKQRRGRAGRVRSGMSYKLYSKNTFEEMANMPLPEIKRISLESLYISVKSMGIKNVKSFLANGLDPPPLDSLNRAEKMLQTIGLLGADDLTLTELGQYVSLMPVMDSKHGKLLIYSIIFGCTDIGVLLVSLLGIDCMPFAGGSGNRDQIKNILTKYNKRGDLIAMAQIVQTYLNITNQSERKKFMNEHQLSYNKMRDITSSKAQYYSYLKDTGFLPFNYKEGSKTALNRNCNNMNVICAILAGALYPSISYVELPDPKFMSTAQGAIEKDPEAKSVKYWIRSEEYIDNLNELKQNNIQNTTNELPLPKTRAFIHPSSVMFSNNNVPQEEMRALLDLDSEHRASPKLGLLKYPFVIYNTAVLTSKLYLRDITAVNLLSVLMFGGPLTYEIGNNIHSPGIILDDWLPIRTWCKNGLLIKELRNLFDTAIKMTLENPNYSDTNHSSPNNAAGSILNLVENIVDIE